MYIIVTPKKKGDIHRLYKHKSFPKLYIRIFHECYILMKQLKLFCFNKIVLYARINL